MEVKVIRVGSAEGQGKSITCLGRLKNSSLRYGHVRQEKGRSLRCTWVTGKMESEAMTKNRIREAGKTLGFISTERNPRCAVKEAD